MAEEYLVPRSSVHPVNTGKERYVEIDFPPGVKIGVSMWVVERQEETETIKLVPTCEGSVLTRMTLYADSVSARYPVEFVIFSPDRRMQVICITYGMLRTGIAMRMVNVAGELPQEILWWCRRRKNSGCRSRMRTDTRDRGRLHSFERASNAREEIADVLSRMDFSGSTGREDCALQLHIGEALPPGWKYYRVAGAVSPSGELREGRNLGRRQCASVDIHQSGVRQRQHACHLRWPRRVYRGVRLEGAERVEGSTILHQSRSALLAGVSTG